MNMNRRKDVYIPIVIMALWAVPVLYGLFCAVHGVEFSFFWNTNTHTEYGLWGFLKGFVPLAFLAVLAQFAFAVVCLIIKKIKNSL